MLKKQYRSIPGKGMMNEVARSVLSAQELSTFNYYINQYQSHHSQTRQKVVNRPFTKDFYSDGAP